MKGSPEVIQALQAALAAESHLNLQYRLDRESLKLAGVKKVAGKIEGFADDAHRFRSKVNRQLLFLAEGMTGAASYAVPPVVEQASVTELLRNELALNMAICAGYERGIPVATAALDDETRNLFEHLVKWHHGHVRWLEQQLRLIAGYAGGESDYITTQV